VTVIRESRAVEVARNTTESAPANVASEDGAEPAPQQALGQRAK
jgi:hypothetical protein